MKKSKRAKPTKAAVSAKNVKGNVALDLAVALRLGATAGAMALPVLRAAVDGPDALAGLLAAVDRELRIAMFVTGSRTVADLRRATLRRLDGTVVAGEPG